VLRLAKVNKFYRVGTHSLHVLRDVDFEVDDGELVSIMGASGSGKSTLLNILGILDDYVSGEYWLGDTLIRNLSESRAAHYRNQFIGFVFQSFNLLPRTTALENVEIPMVYSGGKVERAKALATLERMGLADRAHHFATELSGGEQQRVAIARALMNDPPLLLADEPTGNLDSAAGESIMQLLTALHRDGRTIILVTHDEHVASYASRELMVRDGALVSDVTHDRAPLALVR